MSQRQNIRAAKPLLDCLAAMQVTRSELESHSGAIFTAATAIFLSQPVVLSDEVTHHLSRLSLVGEALGKQKIISDGIFVELKVISLCRRPDRC